MQSRTLPPDTVTDPAGRGLGVGAATEGAAQAGELQSATPAATVGKVHGLAVHMPCDANSPAIQSPGLTQVKPSCATIAHAWLLRMPVALDEHPLPCHDAMPVAMAGTVQVTPVHSPTAAKWPSVQTPGDSQS